MVLRLLRALEVLPELLRLAEVDVLRLVVVAP